MKQPIIRKRLSKKGIILARVLFSLLVILLSYLLVDNHIKPVIQSIAKSQAVILSTKLIDEAVAKIMEEQNVDYEYLVNISTDDNKKVTSIRANSIHINSLKSKISESISKRLAEIQDKKISIPLGTLIGGDFLSGRGPRINFYITLTGNVASKFVSSFYSAGINQTAHSIGLDVTTSIYIVCPGYNTSTKTNTNIALAESVIVGEVPETYNYIAPDLDDYIANYPTVD